MNAVWKEARVLIPFAIPFLFAVAYAPVNRTIVVDTFGCGCEVVGADTGMGIAQFNANHFNAILYAIVFLASVTLAVVWSRGQDRSARIAYLCFAVVAIGISTALLYPIWI